MEIVKIVLIIAVGLFVVSYVLPLLLAFIIVIVARAVKAWKHRKTYSGDDNTLDYWEYNEINFGEEETTNDNSIMDHRDLRDRQTCSEHDSALIEQTLCQKRRGGSRGERLLRQSTR